MKTYKTELGSVQLDQATEEQKSMFDSIQKALGFIPNLYKNLANVPSVLRTYLQLGDTINQIKEFSPAEKDLIALAVSKYNDCNYCVAVHSFLGRKMTQVPLEVLEAINNNSEIPNKKLKVLYEFVQEMIRRRGFISEDVAKEFIQAGYEDKHILLIVLLISQKTISNYANHLFETELDKEFK